jgi:hypothetical protein
MQTAQPKGAYAQLIDAAIGLASGSGGLSLARKLTVSDDDTTAQFVLKGHVIVGAACEPSDAELVSFERHGERIRLDQG